MADEQVECDACYESAKYLDYRIHPDGNRTNMWACETHNRLAEEYKAHPPKGETTEPNNDKKKRWLDLAPKPAAPELADKLMSPDRTHQFHTRQLNAREKYVARDTLERNYPSRDL